MKKVTTLFVTLSVLSTFLTAQSHWESIILYDISYVNSVYLRIDFQLENSSVAEQLLLDIDYDDAFIAYLNDHEVARSYNVTDDPPLFNSSITALHEAIMYQGGQPERFELSVDQLVGGNNTFAVQILNESTNSSDLTGIIFLHAKIDSPDILFRNTPDWFREPLTYEESNLPMILINTHGQWIPDEPKIEVHMGIINNPGGINQKTDPFTDYDGIIGIEIRGSSSQMFEKKNYTIETRTETGENNNVSLLGLPAENDWVLHGPYSDKTLMRNALTFQLGNEMGQWAPRTRFCELFINNDYHGVYLLMEKIKRDSNRVNISKLNPDEISGSDLSGGYILSIDRPGDFWISPYPGMYGGDIIINYIYPEYEDMPTEQREYIKNYVTLFEYALSGMNKDDPSSDYKSYADVYSFIDYFLINELNRNVDAYRLSAFFYKDKNGKLVMGPLWDHNLSFGNADYYQGFNQQGWVMYGIDPGDGFQVPFWWPILLQDSFFKIEMKKRWQYLRQDPFHVDHIYEIIDSLATVLDAAKDRNFYRFPVLGQYIWPNYFIGQTYEEEIEFMKDWIYNRIQWMDAQIALISPVGENKPASAFETYAFPNPFTTHITIRTMLHDPAFVTINIFNFIGQVVYKSENNCMPGLTDFTIPDVFFNNQTGMFIYEVRINGERLTTGKIVRQ